MTQHAKPDADALIVGGGHNGLVCAFYLARAGLRVRVLERRGVVGGAAVTETFAPGFRNSTASYTVSLLQPKVIADMGLVARGYRVIERPIANFLPLPDGNYLKVGGGLAQTQAAFAKFSVKDAERLPAYYDALERVAAVLRALALRTPPNTGPLLPLLAAALDQGRLVGRLGREDQRNVIDLFTRSASDFLDGWFESDPVKAAFGFDAVVGNYASPHTPGSAYVLLHHVFGEVNGKAGTWGHVVGGMGRITELMAAACTEAGVELSVDHPVTEILTEGGIARAVRLETGRELRAPIIISNVGPRVLYLKLLAPDVLPPAFLNRARQFRAGSGTFRMNVALSDLPRFSALPAPGEHHRSGIVIAPSLDYMDRAFIDARKAGWSAKPIVEMLIPSTVDDSLAPAGQHVASVFCQQFAPTLPDGRDWDDDEGAAVEAILQTVEEAAPGFRKLIIGQLALSPKGLERRFGLAGGDIFHGHMSLDQLWMTRPMLGYADYRTPIAGLYLCGSGAHPGGGVTGAPGHNAAREILKDVRRGAHKRARSYAG